MERVPLEDNRLPLFQGLPQFSQKHSAGSDALPHEKRDTTPRGISGKATPPCTLVFMRESKFGHLCSKLQIGRTLQTAPYHNKFQTLEAVAKPVSLLDGLPGSHPKTLEESSR